MTSEFGPLTSAADLQQKLATSDLRIVDCRFDLMNPEAGRSAWIDGHIPGAIHADLDNDLAGPITGASGRHPLPGVSDAAATFGRLGIDNASRVVVYDSDSGAIAARAWWMLRWLGHRKVALLDGGFAGWIREQRPTERGEIGVSTRKFSPSAQKDWILTTEWIEGCIRAREEYCLVDARDAARFAGESEPIDPVAGHVPGALNLPFSKNLRGDGRWKTPRELRVLWGKVIGDRAAGQWGVMCGSGVTACHLALSAALAGLEPPRLYVGSWSEWIRDPERPVAIGRGDP